MRNLIMKFIFGMSRIVGLFICLFVVDLFSMEGQRNEVSKKRLIKSVSCPDLSKMIVKTKNYSKLARQDEIWACFSFLTARIDDLQKENRNLSFIVNLLQKHFASLKKTDEHLSERIDCIERTSFSQEITLDLKKTRIKNGKRTFLDEPIDLEGYYFE